MMQIGAGLFAQRGASVAGGGSAPVNTVLPAITGSPVEGQTLTASTGTWTGSPAPTFAIQWQRGGVAIAGATGATYVLTATDVGTTITVAVTATNASGSASATSAGVGPVTAAAGPATLPVTPTARWHPGFSTVTTSGDRVVSATDLMGLAGVTEGAAGIGPKAMTDALGRKFWRFEGAEFLNVAATLTAANARDAAVFMVGRMHRNTSTNNIFSFGNVANGTVVNTGNANLAVARAGLGAPFVRAHGSAGSADATNRPWMVAGSQLQVLGAASRVTAQGGCSLWLNTKRATVAQGSIAATGLVGGEIGRYAFSPGASGSWGQFDLYELVVYNTAVSAANGDAISAALMAAHNIADFANTLVLEGDSITQGTGLVTSGLSAAMILTEPGAGLIPVNWRVLNMGSSGSQVADLVVRRDDVNGWPSILLAGGQNVVAFEIGRNDFGGGAKTAAQHYTAVTAYLNTVTTGVLQRGWTIRQMANIAGAGVIQTQNLTYRALIRDAQYLTDTQTNAGGAFAGKLSIVSTDLIEDGAAGTVFATEADAADTAYYAGDSTHPSVLGARLRINGGTTPAYGVAAGL